VDTAAPLGYCSYEHESEIPLISAEAGAASPSRQLELNLWPNRQTLSGKFWKEFATTRKRRSPFSTMPRNIGRLVGNAAPAVM
jgi:hypothetical protein